MATSFIEPIQKELIMSKLITLGRVSRETKSESIKSTVQDPSSPLDFDTTCKRANGKTVNAYSVGSSTGNLCGN
jgi:hypothetical protein